MILVHFGSPESTLRCLGALERLNPEGASVVIADNGPQHLIHEAIRGRLPGLSIEVIELPNPGFGAGNNAAAAKAFAEGAQWVWFLNNDAIVDEPILENLTRWTQTSPEVGMWGTLQRDGQRTIAEDRLPAWFPANPCPTPAVADLPEGCRQLGPRETLSGASILVTRKAWEQLGPWPDWCFLYWEDVAWCLKAHAAGIPIVMTSLEVLHERNTTTGHHSPLTTYYGVRNSLLLHRDLWPGKRSQRLFHALHLVQKRLFQGRWRMLGPTIKGIRDAGRGIRFRVL